MERILRNKTKYEETKEKYLIPSGFFGVEEGAPGPQYPTITMTLSEEAPFSSGPHIYGHTAPRLKTLFSVESVVNGHAKEKTFTQTSGAQDERRRCAKK